MQKERVWPEAWHGAAHGICRVRPRSKEPAMAQITCPERKRMRFGTTAWQMIVSPGRKSGAAERKRTAGRNRVPEAVKKQVRETVRKQVREAAKKQVPEAVKKHMPTA